MSIMRRLFSWRAGRRPSIAFTSFSSRSSAARGRPDLQAIPKTLLLLALLSGPEVAENIVGRKVGCGGKIYSRTYLDGVEKVRLTCGGLQPALFADFRRADFAQFYGHCVPPIRAAQYVKYIIAVAR